MHRAIPEGFQVKQLSVSKKADGWYLQICLEDVTVPDFITAEVTSYELQAWV
jgi:putative transposase